MFAVEVEVVLRLRRHVVRCLQVLIRAVEIQGALVVVQRVLSIVLDGREGPLGYPASPVLAL